MKILMKLLMKIFKKICIFSTVDLPKYHTYYIRKRKEKNKYMKYNEAMNISGDRRNKMNEKEYDEALKPLIKSANKKLDDWRKAGGFNIYTVKAMENKKFDDKGHLTIEGLSLNQKKKLLKDLQIFNKAKSSSVKKAAEMERKIGKRINSDYENWSEEKKKAFWEIYERIKEKYPALFLYDKKGQKAKAIRIQKTMNKKGLLLTTKGKERKIFNKKTLNEIQKKLEMEMGFEETEIEKQKKGREYKERIMREIGRTV